MKESLSALARCCRQLACPVVQQEPMSAHTTFKIGGPADLFITPRSEQEIMLLLGMASKLDLPVTIVGRGSNLLVADEGVRGAVICLGEPYSRIRLEGTNTLVCQAGASLASVCKFAADQGLSGLEFAWGIPGTVGGAVVMNAGAYGGEMKDVVTRVLYLTLEGEPGEMAADQLDFSYRHSAFSHRPACVTQVTVALQPGDREEILARMKEIGARRTEKQPLDYPSAGSTFKRPAQGYASALIDQCGLKGRQVGGAQVSEKHAGFLINRGGATCADVVELMAQVREEVFRQKGIRLEPEVKIIR